MHSLVIIYAFFLTGNNNNHHKVNNLTKLNEKKTQYWPGRCRLKLITLDVTAWHLANQEIFTRRFCQKQMFYYQFYVHHLQHFPLPAFCWIKWCIPITATSLHPVSQDWQSIESKHPDLKGKQRIFNLTLAPAWAWQLKNIKWKIFDGGQ